ncbi:13060_t:CDS:10 [Funneliformis geosporum]|nr:13060_t:CDS:10 [Funneliformis geosporum]
MKELFTETSQYRNWYYYKEKLQEIREKNHTSSVKRVKQKVLEEFELQKQISAKSTPTRGEQPERVNSPRINPSEIEYLKMEDELALCNYYQTQIGPLANQFPEEIRKNKFTDKVKRFYLRNTIMDYHPRDIIITCLFLAAKTEFSFVAIEDFIKLFKRLTKEVIFDLELTVARSLRYEFAVHHPYLGAYGLFLDMQTVLKDAKKIQVVYEKSKELIHRSLFTDTMFLYQPSQIALATARMAAKEINLDLNSYLRAKFNSEPDNLDNLYKTLDEIERTIKEYEPTLVNKAKEIDARLHKCKNPEKNPNSAIATSSYYILGMSSVKRSPTTSVGCYSVGAEIGRGSFATVYKGYLKNTREPIAIKSVLRSKLTKKLLENLESEIQILKGIRHDHIVQLVDCKKTDTHIYLIMEFCSMGDLSNYIKQRRNLNSNNAVDPSVKPTTSGLNEYVVRHFLKQLANALEFLRSQNLIHRDIKPQPKDSIVGSAKLPTLKIADFGFARILPSTSMAETLCGSPLYMAPEILRYEKYDAKADLWSVGAVLYEMSVGKPPFRAQNHVELLRKIEIKGDRIKFPNDPAILTGNFQLDSTKTSTNKISSNNGGTYPVISEDIKDLIRHLLKRNPVERISFEEFFMHVCVVGKLEPMQPKSSARTMHSKERSSHDMKGVTIAATANDEFKNNQIRDRSRSSPVPVMYKENSNINQLESPQLHTRPNSSRKDCEISQKGNINLDCINPLQRKNSRNTKYPDSTKETTRNNENHQVNLDLHPSYDNPSPSSSLLVQKPLNLEAANQKRSNENETSNNRSNGEELTGYEFEREYVLVGSKRTVEVNKLADELAASPKHQYGNKGTAIVLAGTSNQLDLQYRTPPPSVNSSGSYLLSTTPPFALPITINHERANSVGSNNSASSALARALSAASDRLFGTGNSPPSWSDKYSKQKGNAIVIPSSDFINDPAEDTVVKTIEEHAHKAYVVFQFAKTKFNKLLPPPPSASCDMVDDTPISEKAAAVFAEEAFVLYLRALAFLQAAMDNAKEYWTNVGERNVNYPGGKRASPRLIAVVQWVRARFNECCDKAEYAKSKFPIEERILVESLLYDRALEMSRQAAVNELVGEDLPGCEKAYQSAIYMLNSILDAPLDSGEQIDNEDRKVVNRYIKEINKRLSSLRKKLANTEIPVVTGQNGSPG